MPLVAVYGSLRQDHGNHRLLETSEYLGTERIDGWEMTHVGGFPGARPINDPTKSIVVEVYNIDDTTLERLNRLEGYNPNSDNNTFYDRTEVDTSFGSAYIYVYQGEFRHMVEHGDWSQRDVPTLTSFLE